MSFGALIALALGLSMDATAVAAARGAVASRIRGRDIAAVALLFGGLHALMLVAGWIVGATARSAVERWDHWIAFALLVAIGVKMLWDARRPKPALPTDHFGPIVLSVVAFATSIDALGVGITLPLLDVSLFRSVATLGGVTALACAGGLVVGHRFGSVVGRRFEAIGGLALVVLGTKILVEHLGSGR